MITLLRKLRCMYTSHRWHYWQKPGWYTGYYRLCLRCGEYGITYMKEDENGNR